MENFDFFDKINEKEKENEDLLGIEGKAVFDQMDNGILDETTEELSPRQIRLNLKREFARIGKQAALKEIIKEPPNPGEEIHVVSANKFDFWEYCPVFIDWIEKTDNFYCATWTANLASVRELLRLVKIGKIGTANFLLGTYFKRREPVVYTMLYEGLAKIGGRVKCFETHVKVLLLDNPKRNTYITVEGSANLTANPRLEQYVITNDRRLWEFHREWMDEMLEKFDKRSAEW